MEFAHRELRKRGWKDGKGLGKSEDGISQAIKCEIKFDHGGFGHDPGEQFTYNWWEHVFKKALDRVNVEDKEGEVRIVSSKSRHIEGTVISSSHSSAVRLASRGLLYGRFVKASENVETSDSSESESDESTRRVKADDELLKACGGRTANRAARHGLGLNGKLKRIQMQEEAFAAGSSSALSLQSSSEERGSQFCPTCETPIRKRKYRDTGRCLSCYKTRKNSSKDNSIEELPPCCDVCGSTIQKQKYRDTGRCRSCSKAHKKSAEHSSVDEVSQCCLDCGSQIQKQKYKDSGRCRSCYKSHEKSSEDKLSDVPQCCGHCGAVLRKRKYRERGCCRSCLKSHE